MYNDQLQFLLLALAGWINRHQQDVIEYLKEGELAGCRQNALVPFQAD